MNILIMTPVLSQYDAVSNDVLAMRDVFTEKYPHAICHIYAETLKVTETADVVKSRPITGTDPESIKNLHKILGDETAIVLYHHSVYWENGEKLLKKAKGKVIFRYHCITPPSFFEVYNEEYEEACKAGIEQLSGFMNEYPQAVWLCDSKFNAGALSGVKNIRICPPFNVTAKWAKTRPDTGTLCRLRSSGETNLLFVGRISPNKGHLLLIDILKSYINGFGKNIKLHIIGTIDTRLDAYYRQITSKINAYGLEDNVQTVSQVSDETLMAYYLGSDFFVSASEHEGFFVPAVEAQYMKLPVIARAAAAVPETLGPDQILLGDDPQMYASAIHTIQNNAGYYDFLRETGYRNFKDRFSNEKITQVFTEFIDELCAGDNINAADTGISVKQPPAGHEAPGHNMPPAPVPRIALVVQRYGREITGGSESLAMQYASRLTAYYSVDVLTTTCDDYTTWKNHYQKGEEIIDGVRVIRFETTRSRNSRDGWNKICVSQLSMINAGMPTEPEEDNRWVDIQGPYCPDLTGYISENQDSYEAFLFMTYLYYPFVRGVPTAAHKAVAIPTAHDEPWIKQSIFRDIFRLPQCFCFMTGEERDFIHELFDNRCIKNFITGTGIEIPDNVNADRFRDKYGITGRYAIYAGRLDESKGIGGMISYFLSREQKISLVLLGSGPFKIPKAKNIYAPGFVDEQSKYDAIAGAEFTISPSKYESLCIALLEGFALGIPALANGQCDVLRGHIEKSGAGLCYEDAGSFCDAIDSLLMSKDKNAAMRDGGRQYIKDNYTWECVMEKLRSAIEYVRY